MDTLCCQGRTRWKISDSMSVRQGERSRLWISVHGEVCERVSQLENTKGYSSTFGKIISCISLKVLPHVLWQALVSWNSFWNCFSSTVWQHHYPVVRTATMLVSHWRDFTPLRDFTQLCESCMGCNFTLRHFFTLWSRFHTTTRLHTVVWCSFVDGVGSASPPHIGACSLRLEPFERLLSAGCIPA